LIYTDGLINSNQLMLSIRNCL